MVFDKFPRNNREVALYFLRKIWAWFRLGLHINYFDIGEFQGMGCGSAQDRKNARHDLALGDRPNKQRHNRLCLTSSSNGYQY